MGCPCNGTADQTPQNIYEQVNTVENQDCEFTIYLLENWLGKLLCVKNNNQQSLINITTPELNALIGVVQSAINTPQNLCLFQSHLVTVRTYIMLIASHVPNC